MGYFPAPLRSERGRLANRPYKNGKRATASCPYGKNIGETPMLRTCQDGVREAAVRVPKTANCKVD
jgi:hypothetical protein